LYSTDGDTKEAQLTGAWTRSGNNVNLTGTGGSGTAVLSAGKLMVSFSVYGQTFYDEFTKSSSSGGGGTASGNTKLKINNQSSYALVSVKWQDAAISSNLAAGSTAAGNVSEGSGYIYFGVYKLDQKIDCRTQEAVVIARDETKEFAFNNNTLVVDLNDSSNTAQPLGTIEPRATQLTIKNDSFTEITDVIWQNVIFANNAVENSIKSGTSVKQGVTKGEGYIFFKRKTNPIVARTKNLVTVAQDESKVFTFDDTTEIVEVNNIDNSGTLGSLNSTVVWWDDAEGDMQPYTEKQSFVGYYKTKADVTGENNVRNDIFTPKNGEKSIAVGGTTSAKLHLQITLSKSAKLSFWYANKKGSDSSSDNSDVIGTWTGTYKPSGSSTTDYTGKLVIDGSNVWSFSGDGDYAGSWTRSSNVLTLKRTNSSYIFASATLAGGNLIVTWGTDLSYISIPPHASSSANVSFTKSGGSTGSTSTGSATFSINGKIQKSWATDVDWSKLEFTLQAGQNDLVWEKKDGYYYSGGYNYYRYLSLDDILIYTEQAAIGLGKKVPGNVSFPGL
jgi:hypothetical protein